MRLKDFRLSKNLSREQLAGLLNVTYQAVHYWETGKRKPAPEKLDDIYIFSEGLVSSNDFYHDSVPLLKSQADLTDGGMNAS